MLCRVQILPKNFGSPVRYRVSNFAQFTADELRHYFVATAMMKAIAQNAYTGRVDLHLRVRLR